MGFIKSRNLFTVSVFVVVSIFFVVSMNCFEPVEAMRPLHGEKLLNTNGVIVLQSLQKGPVPPSGVVPCTNIPGSPRRGCPPMG